MINVPVLVTVNDSKRPNLYRVLFDGVTVGTVTLQKGKYHVKVAGSSDSKVCDSWTSAISYIRGRVIS